MSWHTFSAPSLPGIFTDPAPASPTLSQPERKRLSKQNAAILARLEQGPATNDELSRIARKYTGRLSELRKAGHNVRPVSQDHATGLVVYALVRS